MTDKEILTACQMRMDGRTWEEIGEALSYSGNNVQQNVKRRVFSGHAGKVKSIHPHVRSWMRREGISCVMLAEETGVTRDTVYKNLQRVKINRVLEKAICRMSGLTPEEVQYVKI